MRSRGLVVALFGVALSTFGYLHKATAEEARGGWSGGRPPECDPDGASNVWERAKAPERDAYCARLASGAALLVAGVSGLGMAVMTSPAQASGALQAADEAEAALPGHAATHVLRGRADVDLGKSSEGVAELEAAAKLDPRALDDPSALLALARGQAGSGQMDKTRATYALLLPRSSALPLSDRGAAFFEAGLLSSAEGPTANEEAADRFREAVRGSQDALRAVAIAALALALDRAGRGDEAAALFSDRGTPAAEAFAHPRVKASFAIVSAAREALAMQAMAFEAMHDPVKAKAAWRSYADKAPSGPWRDQALLHASGSPLTKSAAHGQMHGGAK